MFCPKCKSEYKQGITECPECNVALVYELPPEPETKFAKVEVEEVYSTFNLADVALIKSILDAEDIEYYFKGEFSFRKPLVEPVRLIVKKSDAERVRELLKDFK